jgi:D-serine dehydratase
MTQRPDNPLAFAADILNERIAAYGAEKPGECCKGVPPSFDGRFSDLGVAGLSLASGNLPTPVALLKQTAIRSNRDWMRRFLDLSRLSLAPHGKTVMSPEIFRMQMQDGAWGLTAATAQHLSFFAHLGIRRAILANQLVGAENIRIALNATKAHPEFVFHCLIDSRESADTLAAAVRAQGARPLNLLLEIGAAGGRTGTRTADQAMQLARHIAGLQPWLRLSGIEAYEGVVPGGAHEERERAVIALMERMRDVAHHCDAEDLFSADEILLTAGGSEYFDMVGAALSTWKLKRSWTVVIRSGCYIVHDSIAYQRAYERLVARSNTAQEIGHPLLAALEVWATIQSRPERGLAFATLGKRDISHDWDLPLPIKWLRPGLMAEPALLPPGHWVTKLNDQHAYLDTPENSPLQVGDLIGFGISHVCTTFDKWRCLLLVDDRYRVTGAVRTFF